MINFVCNSMFKKDCKFINTLFKIMNNRFKYVFIFFLILYSCENEEENQIDLSPCLNEECSANFWIDPLVSPGVYEDENGYWHIEHQGYNYFTIQGELSRLKENYEINGVPLVSTAYDSDYWVWIDGITFTVPLYSLFGFFYDDEFNNPIPVGNETITIENMANNFPPLNIVGYSYEPNSQIDNLGTYSNYNYQPRQQIFFDNQMVGDTAKIFIRSIFNTDLGPSEEINNEFNIIFE